MAYLSANYEVIGIDRYVADLKDSGSKPGQVAVTFDDAYESYSSLALPVMEEHDIPSALFVSTAFLGKSNEWDKPQDRHPIIDASGLKALSQIPLVTIGAHSRSHRRLTKLSPADLAAELNEPKEYLEQLIGKPVRYLAYPFGQPFIDVNSKVIKAVKQAGYLAAFSTDYSVSNRQKDCFALHRVDVSPKDDLEAFKSRFKPFQARYFKQRIKNFIYALKGS
jgi:peptidoglycan/xylan/chitin deacetylase (PgdA/CDA1 family)